MTRPSADTTLTDAQTASLDALLDLIIPPCPARGLPGAGEVGVLAYMAREADDAFAGLRDELDRLDAQARARHGQGFAALDAPRRQALVDALRAQEPAYLARLAFETYSCYYQDDRVLDVIGLEKRPPYPGGYQVIAGDLTLLAPVRRRGPIYRDVAPATGADA